MSVTATRLTCYAILSAIEIDLRNLIDESQVVGATFDIPNDINDRMTSRAKKDGKNPESLNFSILLDYCDFDDLQKILMKNKELFVDVTPDQIKVIASLISKSVPARNRVCHSRPLEPQDLADFLDLAEELKTYLSNDNLPELTGILYRLETEPNFVLHLTIPSFWRQDAINIPHNLPVPEFDDTGFIGRRQARKDLIQQILSPFPIITIVGEGGAGKTALALRALYDLISDKACPFEVVIWVSLKTQMLTPSGVSDIHNAINNTMLATQFITSTLGDDESLTLHELFDNLIHNMAQMKIIIAIDNLETLRMRGHELRDFFIRIPNGSKIIITSRVGLNELEVRYPLDPLSSNDSMTLMRRFAKAINCVTILKAENSVLNNYADRLHCNPLLIKWFVTSINGGFSPGSLLGTKSSALTEAISFCFSNLFNQFTNAEKTIFETLSIVRRPSTETELRFLLQGNLTSDEITEALNSLHRSSVVTTMMKMDLGVSEYYLSGIATRFVGRVAKPSTALENSISTKQKELLRVKQAEAGNRNIDPYDRWSLHVSTRDEALIALHLRRALEALRVKNWNSTEEHLNRAEEICPTSAEVQRIYGMYFFERGHQYEMDEHFGNAIEQAVKPSAIIYYTYSVALLYQDRWDLSFDFCEKAVSIDPKNVRLLSHKGVLLTRLSRFEDASAVFDQIFEQGELLEKHETEIRRHAADLYEDWVRASLAVGEFKSAYTNALKSLDILSPDLLNNVQSNKKYCDVVVKILNLIEHMVKNYEEDEREFLTNAKTEFLSLLGDMRFMVGTEGDRVKNAKAEKELDEIYDTENTARVKVIQRSKGGWVCQYKTVPLFLPNSLALKNIGIGSEIDVEVGKVTKARYRVVDARTPRFKYYSRSTESFEATVKSVEDYGVFMTHDGFDGLIHMSALQTEVSQLEEGQKLQIKVDKVEASDRKVWFRECP